MENITARLRNAHLEYWGEKQILIGAIDGDDLKGRFDDGDVVHTSYVVERNGDTFTTRNSVYEVTSWASDEKSKRISADHASAINGMVAYFHAKSKDAGWWADAAGVDLTQNRYVIATKLMLIVSEVSEAMEGLRKDLMDDKLPHRKMGEVELGDSLIRIFDLAGALGYDLGGATMEKDAFNSVRADHKPEARVAVGGKAY